MATRNLEFGLHPLAVTPSDSADLIRPSQGSLVANAAARAEVNTACAISVAVAGTVTIVDALGNTQLLNLAAVGQHFCRIQRVKATGTTATGIVVYYNIYE